MPQFSGWHAGVVCYIACIDSQGILVVLHCIDSNGIILQLTRERAPPLLPQVAAAPTKSSPATAALIKPRTVCSQPTHTYSSEFTLLFCGAYTYLLFCCPFFKAPWIILPPMSCAVCSVQYEPKQLLMILARPSVSNTVSLQLLLSSSLSAILDLNIAIIESIYISLHQFTTTSSKCPSQL